MLEHLIATVNAAVRMPVSFPAFTFQPFDAKKIARMIRHLPPRAEYTEIRHVEANGKRLVFPIPSAYLEAFWVLTHPAMTAALMAKLGVTGAVYPRAALIRDEPGYAISIHTDSIKKAATLQVYLAADDHAPHIGCQFYKPGRAGPAFGRMNGLVSIAQVPYLPGSGYFFARTENSWHGVDRTTESDGVRNSLMIVYYRDQNETGFT